MPIRILYPFIKSSVSPFLDIASTFFDSPFDSFSTSTCFVLFEVILLFKLFSLSSKSVSFMKLAISLLLAKFAGAILAAKFSADNLLNSGVVIYLIWSGILFSGVVRAVEKKTFTVPFKPVFCKLLIVKSFEILHKHLNTVYNLLFQSLLL